MYQDHGVIINHLDTLLKEKGLSKTKFCHMAELERTQLNKLCQNKTTRLDTDVLARICHALNCNIDELLEFVPPVTCEPHNYADIVSKTRASQRAADATIEYSVQ